LLRAIGEAHFDSGDYSQARQYLRRADRSRPLDESYRYTLDLLERVLALDPMVRGLSASERYRRSVAVLERTYEYIAGCANPLGARPGPPEPQPQAVRDLLATAAGRLDRRRSADLNEAAESNLLLATNLWSLRDQVCRGVWNEDDVLTLVMRELNG
jgi:hypothetical protein